MIYAVRFKQKIQDGYALESNASKICICGYLPYWEVNTFCCVKDM